MQKLKTVFVTAEVQLTADRSNIGTCIKHTTLTLAQCEAIIARLRQTLGCVADKIQWRYYKHATIIWIETGVALCRRSLRREMRRFGHVLEQVGLAETAEVCSPFKVSYL